jgi:hypothetical protein
MQTAASGEVRQPNPATKRTGRDPRKLHRRDPDSTPMPGLESRIGSTNRMSSTPPEYEASTGYAGTGRWLDRWARHGLQADGGQGRTRARGIGDAEVAVLQREPGDPVARRASVNGLRGAARAAVWRPLLSGDMPCDGHADALNHIRSRHVRQSAPAMTRTRPPQCGQTLRSIANTLRRRSIQVMGAVGGCWPLSW